MNFMMKAGMNQMKDQAKALIPDEMQDKKDTNKDGKNQKRLKKLKTKLLINKIKILILKILQL